MKRHRFDVLSFVFGLIFLFVSGAAIWNQSFRWELSAWVLPAAALFLGIALLVSTLRSNSRGSDDDDEQTASPMTPES